MIDQKLINTMHLLLDIPKEDLYPWLSIMIGSSWIIDKKLHLSEVELSMALKSLRKLITANHRHIVHSNKNKNNKLFICSSIFLSYAKFNTLHKLYYETHTGLKDIHSFLSGNTVIDMGISNTRFFTLLPKILSKISPFELETMFALNSIYRLLVAEDIALYTKQDFYIRGSLLLFHARPFGIGYNANLLEIKTNIGKNTTYNLATGSDIDIRLKNVADFQQSKQQILQCHKKYPDIIFEVAKQQKLSTDFIIEASQVRMLINTYLSSPVHVYVKSSPVRLKTTTEINNIKNCYKNNPSLIKLTDDTLHKLFIIFCHLLRKKNANDETVNILGKQFFSLLLKAKMETDFYGRIKKNSLWEALKSVFLFSGYRLDLSEMHTLFSNLLKQAAT